MKKFIILLSTLFVLSTICLCVGCDTLPHEHSYTETVVAPTCTQRGYTEHKCACGESYNDNYVKELGHSWVVTKYHDDATCTANGHEDIVCEREGCTETNTRERENSAFGHDYTKSYVWDGDECTATAVCSRDESHMIVETVTAKYVKDTDATCFANEKGHYLAEFSDITFADQQTAANSVEIKNTKIEHTYGAIEYLLSNDYKKCTAKITCENKGCTHYEEETVDTEDEEYSAATCTDNKKVKYKATFKKEQFKDYSYVSEPIEIKNTAFGHDYTGKVSYTWSGNQCTATTICKNNSDHILRDDANVEYIEDTEASYTANGKGYYKATFKNALFKTQTNSVEQLGSQKISYISFKTLTVSGDVVSGNVESNVTSFNFENEIKKEGYPEFAVYTDKDCLNETENTVTLAVGENVFYVKQTVTSPYKGETKVFTVTINREYPYYTVSFNTDGGTEIDSQSIKHGECASEPSDPVRAEYNFVGWYIDEEEFNFGTKIYEDIEITAKWLYTEYNVTCSVTVIDEDDNPIKNAELKIYRTDGTGEPITGKTDASGICNFSLEITSENVKLSSYSVGFVTIPYGFRQSSSILGGTKSDDSIVNLSTVTGKSASVKFVLKNIITNSYYEENNRIEMEYKRYYSEGDIVTNGKDTTTVTFDGTSNYKYLIFEPYKELESSNTSDIENNVKAAKGWYKISFETELNGIQLKYTNATLQFISCDEKNFGVPNIYAIVASSEQKPAGYDGDITYYGGNYVEVEVTRDRVDASFVLFVYSESAGNVEIKIEWVRESRDIVRNDVVTEVIDGNARNFNFTGVKTGELVDMPVNGYYELVLDTDGFYHIGKVSGPYLMVQLNKPNSRVGEQAITVLGSDEGAMRKYTITIVTDGGYTINKYDFYNALMGYTDDNKKAVKGYKDYANSDGVFPVNEQLKRYLVGASGSFAQQNTAADGCAWLLACMYYEPEGGLDLSGEGTEDKPYRISSGTNNVKSTGLTYLEFTADETAFYSFVCTDTMFTLKSESATHYNHNGVLYVACTAGSSYRFTVQNKCTLTITKINEEKAEKNIETDESGNTTDKSTGVTADKPISTTYIATTVFVQDNSQAPDGIYVKFESLFDGMDVKFTLYGNKGKIQIKNETGKFVDYTNGEKVTIYGGDSVTLLITTELVNGMVIDGNYLLVVESVEN